MKYWILYKMIKNQHCTLWSLTKSRYTVFPATVSSVNNSLLHIDYSSSDAEIRSVTYRWALHSKSSDLATHTLIFYMFTLPAQNTRVRYLQISGWVVGSSVGSALKPVWKPGDSWCLWSLKECLCPSERHKSSTTSFLITVVQNTIHSRTVTARFP